MLRWSFLVALILFCTSTADAQLPSVYRDDFDGSTQTFPARRSEMVQTNVESGSFIVDKFAGDNDWFTWTETFFDPLRDYEIEAKITMLSGQPEGACGMIFGGSNANNCYYFAMRPNGTVRLSSYVNGQPIPITDWMSASMIKGWNEGYTLTVAKHGRTLTLSVNGAVVVAREPLQISGFFLGLYASRRIRFAVDYLELRQDLPPMRIVKGLIPGVKPERLGPNINSQAAEKAPLVSPDGKTLYVVRQDHPGNIGGGRGDDIWTSTLQPDGKWGPLMNFGRPVNNQGSNAVISVSPDNNSLVIMNTYYPNGAPSGSGFSMTVRTDSSWIVPQTMNIRNFYNRNIFQEASMSPDGKTMVMAVQRDDSFGDKDLYVSFLHDDGSWSEPKNMGSVVNTIFSEIGPFIAADGRTMYYSTAGKRGFGSADIFVTRRLDDTWLKWSEPENLGPDINTKNWDAYYVVTADGKWAYFCAGGLEGDLDIYRIPLPEGARPSPVVLVRGTVYDARTKKTLAANIRYETLADGKEAGIARSNPRTGEYKIVLPSGSEFGFRAEATGYYPVSDNLSTTDLTEYKEIDRDLYLEPLDVGRTIRINNLFFDVGKWDIRPESAADLNRLVALLLKTPTMRIQLSGHTDDVGTERDNLVLSEKRAQSVVQYLIDKGIAASRLTAKGFGKTKPIAKNKTDVGRQLNRRVEFTILQV